MYLSNTEPLITLTGPLNAVFQVQCGLMPQDAGRPLLLLLQIFNLSIISFAVLENVSRQVDMSSTTESAITLIFSRTGRCYN
jgi:hypothetical protein